ncbi:SRPBCC family protein [Kribbella sp. NPDC051770]|uniref:SRPBCC family protein n=1 Tax=Kribbella sp. NPDC051770 TaxID=3155413 RepID=UPI00344598D1
MPDLTESISVAAPASTVYALVSDLPRMGEWSPECTKVTWHGQPPYAVEGSRFVGHNRIGAARWLTQGVVTRATPGQVFTFHIHFGPVPVADWSYQLAPETDGTCTVTETWTDRRPAVVRASFDRVFGRRSGHNQRGIRTTLTRLKQAAESAVR